MPNDEHVSILQQGYKVWNKWREEHPHVKPDLSDEDFSRLTNTQLKFTNLAYSDLTGTNLDYAYMKRTNLQGAWLNNVVAHNATFIEADLTEAKFSNAILKRCNFYQATCVGTNFFHSHLGGASFVETDIDDAFFNNCKVYGLSAWGLKGTPKSQMDLVVTPSREAVVTVDQLEVAQFVYLLLSNRKIGQVIDTIGEKGVLILGRFGDRKQVLDKLRGRLRELGWVPIVFDFEKPESKDFTETVRTLAGMSAFIVADITSPKSVPQEAQAVIPDYMVPFVPLIKKGEPPWAMFQDLWIKHKDWVLEPLYYPSIHELIPKMNSAIVVPALKRRMRLLAMKAEEMGGRSLNDYGPDDS